MKHRKSQIRLATPENHYCIMCALCDEELVPATVIVYIEDQNMMMPLCDDCLKDMELNEERDRELQCLYRGLSIN